jgi:hypothetical protein
MLKPTLFLRIAAGVALIDQDRPGDAGDRGRRGRQPGGRGAAAGANAEGALVRAGAYPYLGRVERSEDVFLELVACAIVHWD